MFRGERTEGISGQDSGTGWKRLSPTPDHRSPTTARNWKARRLQPVIGGLR